MEDEDREVFDNLSLVQSRRALTKDLPAAIRGQAEELANRKNQLDCKAFPRQVGQVSPVLRYCLSPKAPQNNFARAQKSNRLWSQDSTQI